MLLLPFAVMYTVIWTKMNIYYFRILVMVVCF